MTDEPSAAELLDEIRTDIVTVLMNLILEPLDGRTPVGAEQR